MNSHPPVSQSSLRLQLRQRRRNLTTFQQKKAALALYKNLIRSRIFRSARHIAFYIPADGEIDPTPLLKAAQKQKKTVYLPVLQRWPKFGMAFQALTKKQRWTLNRFRIKEPKANRKQQPKTVRLDLILLPLVGFDTFGGRIGMGGGFYDRHLAYLQHRKHWKKPLLIGIAHDLQQVNRLELNTWDITLAGVVTDNCWYKDK